MSLAKALILMGGILIATGVIVWLSPKIPGLTRLGKLPGDIHIKTQNGHFYFPWVTCLLLSSLLSLLYALFRR